MDIQVQDAGTCLKSIKVEVPSETVDKRLNAAYRDLSQHVQLPGFRKGKAPRKLLEKKYSEHVTGDVREQLIREAIDEARREHDLDFIDNPELEEVPDIKRGTAFAFSANAEVKPEFELPKYKEMEFSSREPSVEDKEVDIFIRNIQLSQGELNDLDGDDKTESGDMLSGDFSIWIGEERIAGRPNGNLEVGGDTVLGVDVPEAVEAMAGIAASDLPVEKAFKVTLPESFPLEKHVGKEAEIRVNVKSAARPDAPELNNELAKEVGYDSVDEMREKAREIIEQEKKNQALQDLDNRIVEAVCEATDLVIPPKFAEKQLSSMLQREAFRMYQEGNDDDTIKEFIEQRKEELPATINEQIKESFILDEIGKKERVFVTEEEIVRHIQQIAYMNGQDPNALIERFVEENMIPQIRFELRAGKTKQALRKRAKVTYLDADGKVIEKESKKAKKKADDKPADEAPAEEAATESEE